jgi:hypothetical protein
MAKDQRTVMAQFQGTIKEVKVPSNLTGSELLDFLINEVFSPDRQQHFYAWADGCQRPVETASEIHSNVTLMGFAKLSQEALHKSLRILYYPSFDGLSWPDVPDVGFFSANATVLHLKQHVARGNRLDSQTELRVLRREGSDRPFVILDDGVRLSSQKGPFRVEVVPVDQIGTDPADLITVVYRLRNGTKGKKKVSWILNLIANEAFTKTRRRIAGILKHFCPDEEFDNCRYYATMGMFWSRTPVQDTDVLKDRWTEGSLLVVEHVVVAQPQKY